MKEKLEETIFIKNAMQEMLDKVKAWTKKEKEEETNIFLELKGEGEQDAPDRIRQREAKLAEDE
eukprot:9535834-Heterocapsa_arctica.AAC.1